MKCSVCGQKIGKKWYFCPNCGTKLETIDLSNKHDISKSVHPLELQDYMEVIPKKFASIENMSGNAHGNLREIRSQLGDFVHVNLLNLRRFSFSYVSPEQEYDFYRIGRLAGYYLAKIDAESSWMHKLLNKRVKGGDFWDIIGNRTLQRRQQDTWRNLGIGVLSVEAVDKKSGIVRYNLDNSPSSIVHRKQTPCFMEVGVVSGMVEALYKMVQDDIDGSCPKIEVSLQEGGGDLPVKPPTREELDAILFDVISLITDKAEFCRGELSDFSYMAFDQMINYFFLTLSPGHAILSKQAGKICGVRLCKEADLDGINDTLNFLSDMFLYLRAGIIHYEEGINQINVRMDESIYASGVDNVGINLCIFFAGIIEGALSKATDQKWYVAETKCAGNNHIRCEFNCKLGD